MELHGLDTDTEVFFYEQDFYVLSNFSAFNLCWKSRIFCTAEAAYHFEKFDYGEENTDAWGVALDIYIAPSAHDAFKIAEQNKALRRPDWDAVKVGIMHSILRAKADQHEYVRRKLLATGNRCLIENSWRDDFWGWGPNRDGKNMLGTLWMKVRAELREQELQHRVRPNVAGNRLAESEAGPAQLTQEWCENMAKQEAAAGDLDCSVGAPTRDLVERLRDSSGGHINGLYDREAADAIENLRAALNCGNVIERLQFALQRLADAADTLGVNHFGDDWLSDEVQELQAATRAARLVLGPNASLSGGRRPSA